jgi:choline-sulfatase
MIKRDHLKYQYYGDEVAEMLFDLGSDPGETRNVATSPEHAGAMREFRARLAELGHGPDADPNYRNAGYEK